MPKCTNLGCLKEYKDEENNENACVYHDGKPIFHDLKKGWNCCNQIVYDWDEFQKLKGCKVGKHVDSKKEDVLFSKSDSVTLGNLPDNNNQNNSQKIETPKIVVKDINEYEKEQQRIAEEKKKLESQKEKFPMKNSEGKFYCSNAGCTSKTYKEEENNDTACKYHVGKPVFHDLVKYWTCCKIETWDWDEFMKIPTCGVGKHIPKYN